MVKMNHFLQTEHSRIHLTLQDVFKMIIKFLRGAIILGGLSCTWRGSYLLYISQEGIILNFKEVI